MSPEELLMSWRLVPAPARSSELLASHSWRGTYQMSDTQNKTNKLVATDDEIVFVAKQMDISEHLDWNSPDHNHVIARENAKRSAKQFILAYRACERMESLGTKPKETDGEKKTAVEADKAKLVDDQNRLASDVRKPSFPPSLIPTDTPHSAV